jgi:hypothetical protein
MLNRDGWPGSEARELADEIDALGLDREVFELATFGITLVPAERTGAAELCAQALARAAELIEQRTGTPPDFETGATHTDVCTPSLYHFLHEDDVFQDLLLHPMALALATSLVGRRCVVGGTELFMKGPASRESGNEIGLASRTEGLQLGLHSDNVTIPEPFPIQAHSCNVTWLLSDYTRQAGALAFVPGSHRLCRQPRGNEGAGDAVAMEAPAGSLVVWHGNTWHGSYPRTVAGLRTGLAFVMAREYMRPHEPIGRDVDDSTVAERPPRFATLVGRDIIDWAESGPDYARLVDQPYRYSALT